MNVDRIGFEGSYVEDALRIAEALAPKDSSNNLDQNDQTEELAKSLKPINRIKKILMTQGYTEDALRIAEELAQEDMAGLEKPAPKDMAGFDEIYFFFCKQGKIAEAKNVAEKGLGVNRKWYVYENCAQKLTRAGMFSEAVGEILKIEEKESKDSAIWRLARLMTFGTEVNECLKFADTIENTWIKEKLKVYIPASTFRG